MHILALILLLRNLAKIPEENKKKASNKDNLANDEKLVHPGFSRHRHLKTKPKSQMVSAKPLPSARCTHLKCFNWTEFAMVLCYCKWRPFNVEVGNILVWIHY